MSMYEQVVEATKHLPLGDRMTLGTALWLLSDIMTGKYGKDLEDRVRTTFGVVPTENIRTWNIPEE